MRIVLRVISYLAVSTGFFFLFVPIYPIFTEQSLLVHKLFSVMGGVEVVIVLALVLLALGTWLRRRLIKLRQAENDRIAQQIMSKFRADPAVPVAEFYLYLRAFETTGKLRVPLYLRLRKISIGLFQLVTSDTESYVSNAVRSIAPLIALGRPGEAIGAGRIVTEDANWMADILILMKRAKAILLVPSSRPGTLWEIETLKREGLLKKVIFIMPPRTKGEFDTKERWEAARQALVSHGLEAPKHQERGLLFAVGPDGKVSNVEPMLLNSVRQVRKSMKRMMSDDPPKGGLFRAIAVADRRTRRAAFLGWAETLRQLSPYALGALAIFINQPAVGFNPGESWATVLDRSITAQIISDYELAENIKLAMSEKYRAVEARTPEERLAELKEGLTLGGLIRLDDDNVRALFTALGDMLSRVDTKTCAAIGRGEIQSTAMEIAFTYIPPQRIDSFLSARTAAILAELEDAPIRPLDEEAVKQAAQIFQANLGPEGQQRYERINRVQGRLSDGDQCWLVRVMYGSVATLVEPHASVWARTLAAMALPTDDSTGP
ncbi:MAG TPA: hypothetical protein VEG60_23035 [Candidatus Binatia bacterium]|nr:hypothetical protein [Candidatus Binatia bacterium]